MGKSASLMAINTVLAIIDSYCHWGAKVADPAVSKMNIGL
ncbi:hypothetical protein HMPREF0530_1655 [Lacticaseibacillus paracasei subsp. paracasei ATCC 25302 = DSM 5622 = JCM 8130]|nr:hypothetical protein HMPREF0530_1655 [Lacticaseibacillus paracasei subsp. paracasei ATCC 25302 = DSM 5622 = JCM 8130]EKQ23889.1 hypothetical protein LCAUCD174_0113 [Lacticaseibacillus paracasei]EKQ24160.1 hypothetical protein LCAUW1_0659 [Lacticaseibacillus paracasei]